MKKATKSEQPAESKRVIVSQAEFPNLPLEQVLRMPKAIWDDFAGKGTAPLRVAMSLGVTPTSGPWRNLCGTSIAYGLTEGGYNASEIKVTALGLKIVRPTEEGDVEAGLKEAILKSRIPREFLLKYDNAKFPKDLIAKNVLIDMGLPKERADQGLDILKANAEFAGVLVDIKGEKFVHLDNAGLPRKPVRNDLGSETFDPGLAPDFSVFGEDVADAADEGLSDSGTTSDAKASAHADVKRVFITHGKNQKILGQIEKIVRHGGFEPIIAKDRETAAKPVPDKVLDDMRSCQAAVIHVGVDGVLFDADGKEVPQINQNVLIEIGVARAWYFNRFILLVEEGVTLPSNLQGLYECRYSGGGLDMEATFKLLEAFADFRNK